jgi:RluA family pseudouridine synthase
MHADLDILYEQGPVLAINKPAGLATQAPPGIDSLETRVKAFIKERDHKPGKVYLGVPHRLDRAVSGVIVFARHVRAARRISEQFEGRLVRKLYWACVEGQVLPAEGTWRDWLIKVYGQPRAEVVAEDHPQARLAVLHYRTFGQTPHGSWLEIELETGRTHQVRVQAASRGYPVLGDTLYGSRTAFGERSLPGTEYSVLSTQPFEDERLRAIALHARQLEFRHPMTQECVVAVAPVPGAWRSLGLGE